LNAASARIERQELPVQRKRTFIAVPDGGGPADSASARVQTVLILWK
jgi:hypothetical protein